MMKQKVTILSIALALAVAIFSAPTARAEYHPGQDQPQKRIIPGRVTVMFEENVDLDYTAKAFGKVSFNLPSFDALLTQYEVDGFSKIFPWQTERPKANSGDYDLTRFYELTFPDKYEVTEVIRALSQNPNVRLVEPVWEIPLDASPNDPSWPSQWAMEPPGPDPDYYDAWDMETGSDLVLFGCVDSGVNYNHADLAGNIWVNPGEDLDGDGVVYDTDDLNGIDDDGNGRIDDLIGYDFLASAAVWPGEDGSTPDSDPNDFNGHGTHVAGIAAAMTNNGLSVTGAAGGWYGGHRSYRGIRIMCLRVGYTGTDGNGYVNSNACATAIDYARMMGAKAINASWGGATVNAIAAVNAMNAGVTFCHAAGNDNLNNPDELDDLPGVLSVASVGPSSDLKSSFSNYGFWVDVSAPGSSILSTYSSQYTPTTATLQGTSMSSPMVAGLALLIRSQVPSLTKTQVDSIIVNSTDNIDGVNPSYAGMLGTGRINAYKALHSLPLARFTSTASDGNVPLTVDFTDQSPYSPTSWKWHFGTGDSSDVQNPQYVYTTPGVYDVSLYVDDSSSLALGEEHLHRYVWARADTVSMDSIEVNVGQTIEIPVYLRNTQLVREILFAFQLKNHGGTVKLDTFLTTGLRTDYFESIQKISSDQTNQRFAIRMLSNLTSGSTYLTPDTGAFLILRLNIPTNVTPGTVIEIDTMTVNGNKPNVGGPLGNFWPDFKVGKVAIKVCDHGDANCDGSINVSDLTMIVSYIFAGGPAPDPRGGDVNGDLSILVNDITYLVAYLFQGGPPPPA